MDKIIGFKNPFRNGGNEWNNFIVYVINRECHDIVLNILREFYRRFFEVNPSGRRLFESEGVKIQGRALVNMVTAIVKSLDNPDSIIVKIDQLGKVI